MSNVVDQPVPGSGVTGRSFNALPPIAVFVDPAGGAIGETFTARINLDEIRAAARALEGFAPQAIRKLTAIALSHSARAHETALRANTDRPYEFPEPRSAVQDYFRIRTAVGLAAEESLTHTLRVIADAAEDLADAPLSGSDIRRIGLAIATVLDRYTPRDPAVTLDGLTNDDEPSHEQTWFRRWIIGHQLHAMLNVHAALELRDASESLTNGDLSAATPSIERAAALVEGFAGARAQALAVPAAYYQDVLRPSMLPPLTTVPLSGRMHLEYNAYRERFETFLNQLPMSARDLARDAPALAFARERLIEADLIEAERHVTSVEPLIGDSRSLIQSSKSYDNAVSALRRIRHRRAAAAAPLVRFPDVRDIPHRQAASTQRPDTP